VDQHIPDRAARVVPYRDGFWAEVFQTFQALFAGHVVCAGPRSVSEVWQVMGLPAMRHHDTGLRRVFIPPVGNETTWASTWPPWASPTWSSACSGSRRRRQRWPTLQINTHTGQAEPWKLWGGRSVSTYVNPSITRST
jgi:hypothetical protein